MPDIRLPNGRLISNVPEGITKEEIKAKAIAGGIATEADFGVVNTGEQQQQPAVEQPSSPRTLAEYLLPKGVADATTKFAADTASSTIQEPISMAGQVVGTMVPAARIYKILGSIGLGTAGSEIEQELDINPHHRAFLGNLAVNTAEVVGGEALAKTAQKLLKKVGINVVPQTSTPSGAKEISLDTGTNLGVVTARQAAERQGVPLVPQEAFERGAESANADLARAIDYSVAQAVRKNRKTPIPVFERANLIDEKLDKLILKNEYTNSNQLAPAIGEAVNNRMSKIRMSLNKLENDIAKLAVSDKNPIPTNREMVDYVIQNRGNIQAAFGTKGYSQITEALSDMLNHNGQVKQSVTPEAFDATYNRLLDIADNDPQKLAVLFKDAELDGVDGILTRMVKWAEASGTEYGAARAAYHDSRAAYSKMTNDGVFKAIASGNPAKLDEIFRSTANLDAVQAMLGDTITPEMLETTLRARLYERIGKADGSFSSAKFRTAMQNFSPEVLQRVLGEKGYMDLIDAQVLDLATNSSELVKVVKTIAGSTDQRDLTAFLDATARFTGVAPLASVKGGIAALARNTKAALGFGKDSLTKLSSPKAMAAFDKFNSVTLDDPNAYSLYVNLMRELGVKPLTEDTFKGVIQKPMYEVQGLPNPEE